MGMVKKKRWIVRPYCSDLDCEHWGTCEYTKEYDILSRKKPQIPTLSKFSCCMSEVIEEGRQDDGRYQNHDSGKLVTIEYRVYPRK